MTCIAGAHNKKVAYMACDSSVLVGNVAVITDSLISSKLFQVGEFVIGYSGVARPGQILQHGWQPPGRKEGEPIEKYITIDVIKSMRDVLSEHGQLKKKEEITSSSAGYLLAYKGIVYSLDTLFHVMVSRCAYQAQGSGGEFALGSLHTTQEFDINIRDRIIMAVQAACEHNPYCCPPIMVYKIPVTGKIEQEIIEYA